MRQIFQSIKFALRLSAKTPTNTVLCILVLAGSIALVTSMFQLCHIAFLWSYPYENSERIMILQSVDVQGKEHSTWTFKTIEQLENSNKGEIFSDILPVFKTFTIVRNGEDGQMAGCAYIAWDFDKTFGVKPLLGRTFTQADSDAGAAPVVLISDKFWRSTFKASGDIIGKTVQTGRTERTIVGVMPDSFDFPTSLSGGDCQIWMPYSESAIKYDSDWVRDANLYGVVKDGVSIGGAEKRFADEVRLIVKSLPDENKDIVGANFNSLNGSYMPEGFQTLIKISAACSLLVLFMGCGIVSGLLTARYSSRVQELAIRSALGATRAQIVGQMMAEFALISSASVVLGLLLDRWLETSLFSKYYDIFALPEYAKGLSPFWTGLFIAGVLFFVTLVSSVLPALRASRTDLGSVMRESTRTGSSLRITKLSNFLIASQVAMACVILTCGMMIGLKIRELHTQEKFYNPYDYLCGIVSIDSRTTDEAKVNICMNILRELEAHPDIEKAGITTEVYNGTSSQQWGIETKVWADGKDYEDESLVPTVLFRVVSPGYFASLNVPIIAGRDFTYEDDTKHPYVTAVTDTFARKYFGTTDVLGKSIRMWVKNGQPYTIVAVVPDLFNSRLDPELRTGFFVTYSSNSWSEIPIYLKGRGAPENYEKLFRETVRKANASAVPIKVMNMGVMRDYNGWGLLLELIFTFFSAFSICALILAAAGLYGVISFSVNMRRTEMGIRLSLGASPLGLALHIARRGMAYVAIGLAAGAMGTILARHFMAGRFDQFYDGWEVYALTFLSMLVISVAAVMVPAVRGSVMEPASALRDE